MPTEGCIPLGSGAGLPALPTGDDDDDDDDDDDARGWPKGRVSHRPPRRPRGLQGDGKKGWSGVWATKQFLEEINKWTGQYNVSPLSWNVAVKFLMARKFDVLRAIELFHSYRETRLKEGIVKLKPHEEPLRSELLSGKFTILATKQFLEEINKWTGQYNVSPLSWNVAVKFLMARKFDVLRAIELFHSYRETRLKEGIVKLKPHEEPLRSELLSGKFTILSVRDPSGASIALFTAKLHHPSKSVQHVVLQALFYLLDRAVESFETQRNGLVFIYDMAGSQYTNFELDLSKKILNLLKGAFPARLKKVFIVGAPMWFRVPYSIISLLLKEKLRERVQMVKMSELKEHLPRECLPEYLGGSLKLDPLSWNCRFLPQQNGHPDPLDELILVPLVAPKDNGSVHLPGPKSVTLQELLEAPYNQEKNRYGDVPCLDQTRVKLAKPYSRPELTDYINASFMDGYKQRNAYIGTQGPLENTYGDFWRMVWEQNVLVIVMTTRLEEGGRRKCGQYWPLEKDFQVCFGALTITNLGVENLNHYKKTILEIHSSETKERRLVSHFQYLSWPDYGVPSSAATLIDFLGAVKQQQRVAVSALGPRFKGHPGGPPVVVHCSAGIGRT
ncbi:PREDICTED: tyrosine-protein phosphatase non-receptor type 9, partial [Chaetura pelagica]|uniref:tyrosine-protein phosphatase non-receptor type 9 n=1 Tax=Chaetura pelagica TaxID=8897 RepID=UPI000523B0C4